MKRPVLTAAALVAVSLAPAAGRAQQLFPGFLTPAFRNASGSAYDGWDVFSKAYNQPNYGDVAQSANKPSLTQTLTSSAFITSGFNIYSFAAATGYVIADSSPNPVNSVVFQFDTLGTLIDYNSIRLNFGAGSSLAPANFISENRVINAGFGGLTNRVAAQWDLTSLGVSNFTISFRSLGSSNSFNIAALDTSSGAFSEVVPSARAWNNAAGNSRWDTAANWSGNRLPSAGGNVTFGPGSGGGVILDTTREVGRLELTQPGGGFTVGAANADATLKVNTGITADGGGTPGAFTVSAPVFLGGHGLMEVAAGSTLTISGAVSGADAVGSYPAAGILKDGDGTLALTGNNSFLGSVSVEAGKLILSGVNQYTGGSNITQGELIVRASAPSGAPGALGAASSNVSLGADPATVGPLTEAALVIEGNFTVGRDINASTGANPKAIVARNTSGAGAVFAGNVLLASTATNVSLRAENAGDIANFTGQITGGDATGMLTKTGAGTVVFSGANKDYASATAVSAGTLRIAAGTSLTGGGAMTVGSGATLSVNGTLSGGASAGLTLASGSTLAGTGTVSRTFTVGSGGALSPAGDGTVGTINTVAQTWSGAGGLRLDFTSAAGAAGVGHDLTLLTGALTLSATNASPFVLRLRTVAAGGGSGALADFNGSLPYNWQIASASSGVNGFTAASQFSVDASGFVNYAAGGGNFSVSQTGKSLFLTYTPVPEPSTWAMLAGGLGAGWMFTRAGRVARSSR